LVLFFKKEQFFLAFVPGFRGADCGKGEFTAKTPRTPREVACGSFRRAGLVLGSVEWMMLGGSELDGNERACRAGAP
jgi:hypothetical protein